MRSKKNTDGSVVIYHQERTPPYNNTRLAQESKTIVIGDGGFLWIGRDHHLDKGEVAEFALRLMEWVITGRLSADDLR